MQLPKFSNLLPGRLTTDKVAESASEKLSPAPAAQINDLLLSAVNLHKQGNLDQAEAQYVALLAVDPQNADAMQYLGMLNGQRGHPERAIEFLHQALTISPSTLCNIKQSGENAAGAAPI